jgi:D-threo-aldose 1-dehydrogenase
VTAPLPPAQRRIGRTALRVPPLSLGTSSLGGMYEHVPEQQAHELVRHALARGVSHLDTAPYYGHGTAERRLAAALSEVDRDGVVVATKVGRLVVEQQGGDTGIFRDAPPSVMTSDYSREGVLRSLEESLTRLGLERVDIVYVHDADHHEEQALAEAYPALEELRAQGVVAAIGVGMNQSRIPTRFVRETDIDVVLLAGRFTLLEHGAFADLLPAAAARNVSIVIGGVYNSGLLADPRGSAMYNYAPAPPGVLDLALRLEEVCGRHRVSLAAAAVQFPFCHPSVATVLVGARSAAEVDSSLEAISSPVPGELWVELVAEGLLPEQLLPALAAMSAPVLSPTQEAL